HGAAPPAPAHGPAAGPPGGDRGRPHDPYLYLVHLVDRLEAQPSYDYSFHRTLISICTIACYPDHLAPEMETSEDLFLLFRKAW
ncbi:unnamed protein product, partial [Heterosigma akashiwo]